MKNIHLKYGLTLAVTICFSSSYSQLLPKGTVGVQTGSILGKSSYSDLTNGLNCTFKLYDFPIGKSTNASGTDYKKGISIDFFYNSISNRSFFEKGQDGENPVLDALKSSNKQLSSYGLQFPLRRFALVNTRQMGVRGISMYPKLGIAAVNLSERGVKSKGWGLNASFVCNFPFFILEGGINFDRIKIKSTGVKENIFYPYVSIKADALFEILGIDVNTGDVVDTRHAGNYQYSRVEGDYLVTYSGSYDYTERSSYARLTVKPFWGIAPRYTFASQGYKGATKLYGLGFSGRRGYLGFDAIVDAGKIGYGSNTTKSYLHNPFPKGKDNVLDRSSNTFAAEGNAVIAQVRISMNLFGIALKAFTGGGGGDAVSKTTVSKGDDGTNPSALRIMTGFGFGYGVLSKPSYIYTGSNALKDAELTAEPDLWNSSTNDVRLTKSAPMVSVYFAIEIGAVNVEFGRFIFDKYKASLANGNYATIHYTIPIGKIIKSYKRYHAGDYENE
jgi:hypothetical protein